MMQRFIRYRVFLSLEYQDALAFRVQFWAKTGIALLSLALMYYLWHAIFGSQGELAGVKVNQMMSYLVAASLIRATLSSSTIMQLGETFQSGSISANLVLPVSLPGLFLARSVGVASFSLLTRGVLVFAAGLLLVGIHAPSAGVVTVFAVSVILAFFVYFELEFLTAQLILFTQEYDSVDMLWNLIILFATGALIPLPFFPEWMREILFVLPFQAIFYVPMAIFLDTAIPLGPISQGIAGLGVPLILSALLEQLFWIIVLLPLCRLVWYFTKRKLVTLGG